MHAPAPLAKPPVPPESSPGRWIAYLYFMRFSLVLWVSMLAFVFLDARNISTTATRGIVTLSDWKQCFFASFFIVLTGWIALLSARIVCAYGEQRFGPAPPRRLSVDTDMSWGVFLGAQLPGAILLVYIGYRTITEGLEQPSHGLEIEAMAAIIGGALLALLVWYLFAAYYYWTYEPKLMLVLEGRLAPKESLLIDIPAEGVEARAFLAPVGKCPWFEKLQETPAPAIARVFDKLFDWIARVMGPGFRCDLEDETSPLHAGHALGTILLTFLALLYFVFLQYTAPVWIPYLHLVVASVIAVVIASWFIPALIYWVRCVRKHRDAHQPAVPVRAAFNSILRSLILLLPVWSVFVIAFSGRRNETFPVIASIYILLLFACWGFGGLAFILDRARVPVFTTAVLIVALLHFLAGRSFLRDTWFAEAQHIVQTASPQDTSNLSYPEQVLDRFRQSQSVASGASTINPPFVIVTATGGGIHAAAWTSDLLGRLESAFQSSSAIQGWNASHPAARQLSFHNSVLLISTVSGGSVGTVDWLRAYRPGYSFTEFGKTAGMIAQCSSLEAVAWGLLYPDAFHLVLPFRWWGHLENYDRSWALQAAIERNQHTLCGRLPETGTFTVPTLAEMSGFLSAADPSVPAFSLNSTVAETGSRLLLANYHVHFSSNALFEVLPASSFLDLYPASPNAAIHADLSLTSAARLSASFPYVSSMARVPRDVITRAYHFGDGGYFDNDGTGTAIEFLMQAYQTAQNPTRRDRIFLIEIRNSSSPAANNPPDAAYNQDPPPIADPAENKAAQAGAGKFWNPLDQLTGPFKAFYNAGHESVTHRNRRELCILENALRSSVSLHHYVFEFNPYPPRSIDEPLNWHLTAADNQELSTELARRGKLADQIAADFAAALVAPPPSPSAAPDCVLTVSP